MSTQCFAGVGTIETHTPSLPIPILRHPIHLLYLLRALSQFQPVSTPFFSRFLFPLSTQSCYHFPIFRSNLIPHSGSLIYPLSQSTPSSLTKKPNPVVSPFPHSKGKTSGEQFNHRPMMTIDRLEPSSKILKCPFS